MEPADDRRARYTDEVDFEAGVLTPLVGAVVLRPGGPHRRFGQVPPGRAGPSRLGRAAAVVANAVASALNRHPGRLLAEGASCWTGGSPSILGGLFGAALARKPAA